MPFDTESFSDRVVRLRERTSKDGWKGPGSVAVGSETWDALLEVIRIIADPSEHGHPFVSADTSGTLYAEWELQSGESFTFELSKDLIYAYEQDTAEAFMYSEDLQYRRGMGKNEILQGFQEIIRKSPSSKNR